MGTTAGTGYGIGSSFFYAGGNITSVKGSVTDAYGKSGIAGSKFVADEAELGTGTIGAITGTTDGNASTPSGITGSHFYAGAGIGAILGESYNSSVAAGGVVSRG